MAVQFVDANVFIRHLTRDEPVKAAACFELFKKAQSNAIALTTSEAVIAEVVYVLASKQLYALSRERIRTLLYPLLSLPGLRLPHRKAYLRALDLYAAYRLDFEDALTVAHMERQGINEVLSFDRNFDHLPQVTRLEPEITDLTGPPDP